MYGIAQYFGCRALQKECEQAIIKFSEWQATRLLIVKEKDYPRRRTKDIVQGFAVAVEKLIAYREERKDVSYTCVDNSNVGVDLRREMMHFRYAKPWAWGFDSKLGFPAGVEIVARRSWFFNPCSDWCAACGTGGGLGAPR